MEKREWEGEGKGERRRGGVEGPESIMPKPNLGEGNGEPSSGGASPIQGGSNLLANAEFTVKTREPGSR